MITRRQFMTGAAALATTPLFADLKSRRFRIGACDWSLGKGGNMGAMQLAGEIGLDGVQISFGAPGSGHDIRDSAVLKQYKDLGKQNGTEIAALAMGVLNSRPYKSDPNTVQWVSDSIDAAKAAGVKVVLLAFFGKGDLKRDAAGTAEVIKRLKAIAPKAEKEGIILGLETWLDMDEHLYILDRVGSPNVQVYYDLGNSLHKGYDIYKEIRALGPRICEVHAKDYAGKLFGQGNVDFWEVRRALDDIAYSGWVQIEGRQPYGVHDSYRHDAEFLRGVLGA